MRLVTFKMEEDMLEMLDSYAIRHGLNRSEVIRKAIEKLLQEESRKETVPIAKIEKFRM